MILQNYQNKQQENGLKFLINQMEHTIRIKILRSDLCDFNDAYIVVTGKISVSNPDIANYDRKLFFKNNAPFFSSILKINNQLIEDTQDLDIVMPMDNLLYYSKN